MIKKHKKGDLLGTNHLDPVGGGWGRWRILLSWVYVELEKGCAFSAIPVINRVSILAILVRKFNRECLALWSRSWIKCISLEEATFSLLFSVPDKRRVSGQNGNRYLTRHWQDGKSFCYEFSEPESILRYRISNIFRLLEVNPLYLFAQQPPTPNSSP